MRNRLGNRLFPALAVGMLLAGAPASAPAASFVTAPAWPLLPGQQATVNHCEGRVYDSNGSGAIDDTDMRYRLFVPVGYDDAIDYPVIVWLHGLGSEGNGNTSQLAGDQETTLHLINNGNRERFPHFLVAPQRQTGEWYGGNKSSVYGILDDVDLQYSIDRKRIYLVGVSYGAMGTYAFITNDTAKWAAAVPIAGNASQGGASGKAANLVGFPLWNFHANNDSVVDVAGSDDMIKRIRDAGGAPMYSRYLTGHHGYTMWDRAFATPQLLGWLLAQRLEDTATGERETADGEPLVKITKAREDTALQLEGTFDESTGSVAEVGWWSLRVAARTGSVTLTAGGSTVTISGANFTAADVGSRLFINHNHFDRWNGYLITQAVSSDQVKVSPGLPTGGMSYPYTAGYEICPPGHRRHPQPATLGAGTWSASGLPLASGDNVIGVTARASSFSDQGGNTWLEGRTVTISHTPPAGDIEAPDLAVTAPSGDPAVVVVASATIDLGGTASDNGSLASVGWSTGHGAQGAAAGTASWSAAGIPLHPGHNTVTLRAADAAGNTVARIVTVVLNQPPVAAPDAAATPGETGCEIDVLANDSDPDAQPLALAVTAVGGAAHGVTSIRGSKLRYLPAAGFRGTDSFSYTITDGVAEASGQVQVEVAGTVEVAETLHFEQDFEAFAAYPEYISASAPGLGEFNDISAETGGGAWSIDSGKLKLVRAGGSSNGAGFMRYTDLPGTPQFVRVAFTYSLNGLTNFSAPAEFDMGTWSAFNDYNNNSLGSVHNRLVFIGRGAGKMAYGLGGYATSDADADGTPRQVEWYVNGSAAVQAYIGPDGFRYEVEPNRSSLWVDGALLYDNVARVASYTSANLADFRLRSTTSTAPTLTWDDFSIVSPTLAVNADPPAGPLDAWRQLHGLAADGSQDLAAPAGDGVPNLLKYALNLAPNPGDLAVPAYVMPPGGTAGLPRASADGSGNLLFTFVRRQAATDPGIVYSIEQSSDLSSWAAFAGTPAVEPIDAVWERVSCTVAGAGSRSFLRLKVQRP